MLITPTTKTITEYALTLTESDAAQCFVAPYEFAERIAAELRAAGVAPAANGGGNGHKPGKSRQLTIGRKPKAARASRPNGKAGATCPQCGKTLVTQGMLERHLRQKHGHASTASAVESSSTN